MDVENVEWNNTRKDANRIDCILDTLSGTAKKLRSTFATFTEHIKSAALNFTAQSTRKSDETAMLEVERRKAEAITIIRYNDFC